MDDLTKIQTITYNTSHNHKQNNKNRLHGARLVCLIKSVWAACSGVSVNGASDACQVNGAGDGEFENVGTYSGFASTSR